MALGFHLLEPRRGLFVSVPIVASLYRGLDRLINYRSQTMMSLIHASDLGSSHVSQQDSSPCVLYLFVFSTEEVFLQLLPFIGLSAFYCVSPLSSVICHILTGAHISTTSVEGTK